AKRGELILQTTHELLNPASPYYIPGAAGIKSGFTSLAGSCYVGAAQRGDRTLIAVVLGSPSTDRTWQDLSKLFEYGFATQ
ncbi:MAG: D-alanyl-D-alanine carboxypeptidase, partial [Clostridia bacterium]